MARPNVLRRRAQLMAAGLVVAFSTLHVACVRCGPGQAREDGVCVNRCNSHVDCGKDSHCDLGRCLEGPPPSTGSSSSSSGNSSSAPGSSMASSSGGSSSSLASSGFDAGPLSISPHTASLRALQSEVFVASGGTAPYRFSVESGPGAVEESTGRYVRPWQRGPSEIRLTDSADASVAAQVEFLPGSFQLGSSADDSAWDVERDEAGNVFIVGQAGAGFEGQPTHGDADYVLMKLFPDGARAFVVQDGTAAVDVGVAVLPDGLGGAYVAGHSNGPFTGTAPEGYDLFVAHFDGDGLRTTIDVLAAPGDELLVGAARDGTRICLAGSTTVAPSGSTYQGGPSDALVVEFAPQGSVFRPVLFGTAAFDNATACVLTSDGIKAAGYTAGGWESTPAQGMDIFVADITNTFNGLTLLQGSGADRAFALVDDVEGGARYLCGYTDSPTFEGQTLHGTTGENDVLVVKVDGNGDVAWARLLGSGRADFCYGLAMDPDGSVYVAGGTTGDVDGFVNAGQDDGVIFKLATDGTRMWTRQLGGSAGDSFFAVTVDAEGLVVGLGDTLGTVDGNASLGGRDLFLLKLAPDNGDRL